MRTENNLLRKIIKGCFGIVCVLILALLLFCDKNVSYPEWARNQALLPNITLVLMGAVVLAALFWVWKKWLSKKSSLQKVLSHGFYVWLWGMSFLLFALQVFLSYHLYFVAGWDVSVVTGMANWIRAGTDVIGDAFYFSQYTNNVGIVYMLALVAKAAEAVGYESYYVFVIADCAMIDLAGILTALSVKKIMENEKAGLFAFVLFTCLIGIHPWMVVPYTDTYSILFPILTLYLYLCAGKAEKFWQAGMLWFLLGLSGLFGYYIKPSAVIVLIAVVCYEAVLLIVRKGYWKRLLFHLAMLLIAVACSQGLWLHMLEYTGSELQEELQFSYSHYLMLGLNEENVGAYSPEDYAFSSSQPDRETRTRENWRIIRERLRDYGVRGYLKFIGRKILVNYNDGTFAWEKEGNFELLPSNIPQTPAQIWVRKLFRKDADWYPYYATFAQGCWIAMLFLLAFMALRSKLAIADLAGEDIVYISFIGSFLFVMLFEARARYLYNITPIYVVGAAVGMYKLYHSAQHIARCFLLLHLSSKKTGSGED